MLVGINFQSNFFRSFTEIFSNQRKFSECGRRTIPWEFSRLRKVTENLRKIGYLNWSRDAVLAVLAAAKSGLPFSSSSKDAKCIEWKNERFELITYYHLQPDFFLRNANAYATIDFGHMADPIIFLRIIILVKKIHSKKETNEKPNFKNSQTAGATQSNLKLYITLRFFNTNV